MTQPSAPPPVSGDNDELINHLRMTMRAVANTASQLSNAPRRSHVRLVSLVAALLVAMTGAGLVLLSTRSTSPLPPLTDAPNGALLERARFSFDEEIAFERAQERMRRDCMATAGFTFTLRSNDEWARYSSGNLDDLWSQLGRTDATRATTIGYLAFTGTDTLSLDNGLEQRFQEPGFENAFWGGSAKVELVNPITGAVTGFQGSGGCFGQVFRLLLGDQGRFGSLRDYLANDIESRRVDDFAHDPRLTEYVNLWSACMNDKGHSGYRVPLDVVRHFGGTNPYTDARVPTADELATARDDVACKQSTGLLAFAVRLRNAYLGQALTPQVLALTKESRAFIDHALAQVHAYESGELVGPWRTGANKVANSSTCAWLPGAPSTLNMSVGERQELIAYLKALGATTDLVAEAASVAVPPWIMNGGNCTASATSESARSLLAQM